MGLDVGDRWSQICALDQESGEVVEEGRVRTSAEALGRRSRGPRMRVVLEVGCQSPWIGDPDSRQGGYLALLGLLIEEGQAQRKRRKKSPKTFLTNGVSLPRRQVSAAFLITSAWVG